MGLMMEQTHTSEGHGDAVFVAGHDDMIITHRTTSLGDILHTALMSTFDIVAKGEERITAQTHFSVLGNPFSLPVSEPRASL